MNVKQNVECTLFPTAFDTKKSQLLTLSDHIDGIKSDKYEPQISYIRFVNDSGDGKKYAQAKKQLPLLVAGGTMEGGRKIECMVRYSQCVSIDIDHVPGSADQVLVQASALPYIKAGYVSPSGRGVKLFVLVDSDLAHHYDAFEYVRALTEGALPGLTVDTSGKDPNRGCFVSHDPNAFYKEVSEVIHVPLAEAAGSKQPVAAPKAAYDPTQTLANYITKFETGNVFAPGGRHSYVLKLASALNNAGFDLYDVTRECVSRYAGADFGEKEIREIVADVYRRYGSSHGSNPWCPPVASPEAKSVKSARNTTPFPENASFEEDSPLGPDIEPEEACLPHFDQTLLSHLPKVVADAVAPAGDETEYDIMLLAALNSLSTTMPNVTGMLKTDVYEPPYYTLIIGPSGSGKGCISQVHKLVEPWQKYVFDNSRHEVEEYEVKHEAYEFYKQQQRLGKKKQAPGLPPENPPAVRQKQLHISGYTTTARLIEQLEINQPYASFLFETELESVNNTMAQDFGGYGYILNQAFHHESISSSSKTNGSAFVKRPSMGMLATGTPGMFVQLIPSTESGNYSRMQLYIIGGKSKYRPLTSADSFVSNSMYYDNLGLRVLDLAVHLKENPTFVSFSDKQRKRLDRYFEREYYNVRVFGNDDVSSVVLRHRLMIFRTAMTLTGLRKAESGSTEKNMEITDEDYNIAFHIGTSCLKHSLFASTSLKHSNTTLHHKMPTVQQELFADMPDKFKTADILAEAFVRGISRSSIFRMLKKAQQYGLLTSERAGCYEKTDEGKKITNPRKG